MSTRTRRRKRRPGWLRNLVIERVDRVGKGANAGARILLCKAEDGTEVSKREVLDALDDAAEERALRDGGSKAAAFAKVLDENPAAWEVYNAAPEDAAPEDEEEPEPTLRQLIDSLLDQRVSELITKSEGRVDYGDGVTRILKGDQQLADLYALTSFAEAARPKDDAIDELEKRFGRDRVAALRGTLAALD